MSILLAMIGGFGLKLRFGVMGSGKAAVSGSNPTGGGTAADASTRWFFLMF